MASALGSGRWAAVCAEGVGARGAAHLLLAPGRPEDCGVSNAGLLVVCGDVERREDFVRTLSAAGWESVLSASGMTEAAGLMRSQPCACVIVDSDLADIPGPKALRILREICPQARVIFTTPQNSRELEAQVRALNPFYYYISSADRAELVAAVQDAIGAPRPLRARPRPRVLVVDDDPSYQTTVRAVLEGAGYEVSSAYSEREGLEIARRERPDAILLDIIMESATDGFLFCHEARHDPVLKHTPIVGVSAIEKRLGLGHRPVEDSDLFPVDAYLRKPLVREELLSELHRFVPGPCDEREERAEAARSPAPSSGGR
ncbi:MAG: response regulator [Planctomycetes bacterium]|nr:response regulator [Planctomycetota bacterium]